MNNEKHFTRKLLAAATQVKDAIDLKFRLVTGTAPQKDNANISIDQDLQECKNAEAFALKLKVNRKELQSAFKYCNNKGINEYQVDKKIEAACILLANDEMTIKEIAIELDFDQEYFCSVFKKKKGMTPTEWKSQYEERKLP